jgi:CubicO group peptidase (beta-lactamase class C family)
MKIGISIFLLTLIIACQSNEPVKEVVLVNKVELMMRQYADSILIHPEITAISIGVCYQKEKYSGHYGSLEKGGTNKPSDQTIYEIGSVTKTMIGTLVAKAELENKLSIEDDIRNYLLEEYPNLEYSGEPIKIKHLITHTSRLPYFLPLSAGALFSTLTDSIPFLLDTILSNYSKTQFFADLHDIVIDTTPGTRYAYSNAGAEIVGYILTKVYNKSLDELIKEYYGAEHGMSNTGITISPDDTKNIALGRWLDNDLYSPRLKNPLWGAAGNVQSTSIDLLNYMELQLDQTNPVIRKAQTVLYTDGKRNKIAYYWKINEEENEGLTYSHHGGTPGMQNWMYLFPDYDLGISVITNQSGLQTAGRLANLIQQLFDTLKLESEQ